MWWNKKKEEKANIPDYYITFFSKDGELGLNYSFDEDNIENFINLFVAVTTGILASSTYEEIIKKMIARGENDAAEKFFHITKERFDAAAKIAEENDEDPVVSPLDVFRSNE